MDECPTCKKWTLDYYPDSETQICSNCGYRKHVEYDDFIRGKNVIDNLLYPSKKWILGFKKTIHVSKSKYAFHFYLSADQYTGESATSLKEFGEKIKKVDVKSLEFHFHRNDFQSWIVHSIGDIELVEKINNLHLQNPTGESLRKRLYGLVSERFGETKPKPMETF